MKTRLLFGLALVGMLLLAACGTGTADSNTAGEARRGVKPPRDSTLTKQDVLDMLSQCAISSQLAHKDAAPDLSGNELCRSSGSTCIGAFISDVPDASNARFTLYNTLRSFCFDTYQGPENDYYIQAVCCSP